MIGWTGLDVGFSSAGAADCRLMAGDDNAATPLFGLARSIFVANKPSSVDKSRLNMMQKKTECIALEIPNFGMSKVDAVYQILSHFHLVSSTQQQGMNHRRKRDTEEESDSSIRRIPLMALLALCTSYTSQSTSRSHEYCSRCCVVVVCVGCAAE